MHKKRHFARCLPLLWNLLTISQLLQAQEIGSTVAEQPTIRVATYNSSLYRNTAGELVRDLATGNNEQAQQIAEVIQRVRPDAILINEFDYDETGRAAELFRKKYLAVSQHGLDPIHYLTHFIAPVNTGLPSGLDLDNNGRDDEPNDAFGFGRYGGQYGMLVLSRFPIQNETARTFQTFLWRDMPGALLPVDPRTNNPYYSNAALTIFRISSKSFWDVPILIAASGAQPTWKLHLLCSHPTPPVFDGPEDRNCRRNHDEIRLIADYLTPARGNYLVDDAGGRGGLDANEKFVVLRDLNSDPVDGDSVPGAMNQLLAHPRVNSDFTPSSKGAQLATENKRDPNAADKGAPAHDTSSFGDFQNLRIDYALPSRNLKISGGGVFWPAPDEPGAEAVTATDHRLVWIDIAVE